MSNAAHNADLFSAFQENGLVSDKTLDRFDRWAKADEAFCALLDALRDAGAAPDLWNKLEAHYGAVVDQVEYARQECQAEADDERPPTRHGSMHHTQARGF